MLKVLLVFRWHFNVSQYRLSQQEEMQITIIVEHSRLQVSCLFYSTFLCPFYFNFNGIHFLVKQRLHNLAHRTVSRCRVGEATCSPTRLLMLSCASFVCKASKVLLLNYAFLHTCKYIYIWESVNIPMCEKLCFLW